MKLMLEAIILAGGQGTRLRELVPKVPKPMAPVAGRPFLEILLEMLASKGFNRIILSLGVMADQISQHFGERFAGMDLVYSIESKPLGTGGAARLAMSKCCEDHVFIFNGDTFLNLEVDAVELHWQLHRRPIIVGINLSDSARYGRLKVKDGRIIRFNEKGISGPGLINAGCYILNQSQLDRFLIDEPFSLETDYLMHAVDETAFDVFLTEGSFIDIGIPDDYIRAQSRLEKYAVPLDLSIHGSRRV
jgi:D-glycero-alpha-D-manno-heptose 1-phosphate guanylyltransferase